MEYMEVSSPSTLEATNSKRRVKIFGATAVAAVLIVVGVVALNGNTSSEALLLVERSEAIATAENGNMPLSHIPQESDLVTPAGWQVESDEPVEGEGSESEIDEPIVQDAAPIDDEIDSPLVVEQDEQGENYVPDELDENVLVKEDVGEEGQEERDDAEEEGKHELGVAEDARRCYKNLKKCGTFKKCYRRCSKRCKPAVVRRCNAKKFCRCYCKFKGNKKMARKCVVYKRTLCKNVKIVRCKRWCKKFCKNVRRCYCCARRHVLRACRKTCKRISYKSKCGNCRCWRKKCYKICRFYCRKK